ncbi:MAG: hypothetical protein QOF11_1310 [Chloroflexota bacterium]|jgi:hypothetical protein|nr:hypothetical protein [Chloroflexota bacterium]
MAHVSVEPGEPDGSVRGAVFIELDALIVQDSADPRAADDAGLAIDRVADFAEPVVLAGERVAGRLLPLDPEERIAWVREALDRPDVLVVSLAARPGERRTEAAGRSLVDAWRGIRTEWSVAWLVTGDPRSVGPARRAGLRVVRIGPRPAGVEAEIERPDYEARDLRDAVNHLMVADVFPSVPAR